MDLFSIQSMLNSLYSADPSPAFAVAPSNGTSSNLRQHLAHSPALSPPDFYLLHQQNFHHQNGPISPSSDSPPIAFPSAVVVPPAVGTEQFHQLDFELLQNLVHQFGTFCPHNNNNNQQSFGTNCEAPPPFNALLLLLLQQQFRALSNGQSAAVSDPSSVLPLCSPPDFRPLRPSDWGPNAMNSLTMTAVPLLDKCCSSTAEHQLTSPAILPDFMASNSSCSGSTASSLGESKALSSADGGGGTRNPCGAVTAHRLSYPREFKLLVLKSFWANGQNKYRTCKEFQITKSMLNGWLQKADRIKRSRPGSLKSGRSGRRPQYPKIEQQLFEMVQKHLSLSPSGERVSNKWIRKMARKLTSAAAAESNNNDNSGQREEEADGEGMPEGDTLCQFSERWLNNFKRRFGIQTTECGAVGVEADETEGDDADKARRHPLMDAISPIRSPSPGCPTDELWQDEEQWRSIAWEICATNDRLPIQAFYDRFPKVLQQTNGAGGGGKRERNSTKNCN